MTRTYWLSFVDQGKPEGERFLGACVVDVTERERRRLPDVAFLLDASSADDQWVAAAVKKAHQKGCNPGGAVGVADITRAPAELLQTYPRYKLMDKVEIRRLDEKVEQLTVNTGVT